MPIYEYQCLACGHAFEMMRSMSDQSAVLCPACGHDKSRRIVSAPRFKLSGSGWYETDFKHSGKSAKAKPEGESKPSNTSDSEAASSAKSTAPVENTSTSSAAE